VNPRTKFCVLRTVSALPFLSGLAIINLPKRYAILPKKSRNAPLLSVDADDIQVISAVDISRSRPIYDETTVIEPVRSAPIAMAIVAVRTNKTS
jgi:hypothetical protein